MTLNQFLQDETIDTTEEINTNILKIRGKTLVFGNVIYQIHNIASIGLVSNITTHTKPMPKLYIALPIIGIFLFFIASEVTRILGCLIIVLAIWLIKRHNASKTTIDGKYGMTIYTNAGTKKIFRSRSEEFVKKVILTLYSVMNSDELKAITFNFETLDVSTDNSIKIGTNIGSSVISGHVVGDVASQV
ncbi:hypothetical protein NIES37_63920 [Tolypothrix tenuis PCC 7101]|uniref:Uncharacterized protein n=1 Tax=Tolypothrix tenuis PCC 7101 TaxID=231146 RepID=A0A1Z4N9K1_9CYAN|nr:hypothetical protein [Aulosira sp. FACHB-113]BAZ02380.1 hypothetical protein NIES37_63920 [Tolypothrix tenuis PCC 7101]BAZ73699.1 hypothetical protein NIES50_22650 [Aulosira laxa NIES-50]